MKKLLTIILLFPVACFAQNKMWGNGGFNTNGYLFFINNSSDSLLSLRLDSFVIKKPVRSGNIMAANFYGTSVASGTLTFNSTSNATKGNIIFGATTKMYYDENVQTLLGYSTTSQLRFRLGASASVGQSLSTRDGQLSIGIVDDAQNSALRLLTNTSGLSYIDGYSEGSSKATNYDIIIGSRVNNTGNSITGNTTAETGSNVQIGYQTSTIPTSILTLNTTTRGFLPPRMTTTQKNAISSPSEGLIVYDLTLHKLCVYNGSAWETITSL